MERFDRVVIAARPQPSERLPLRMKWRRSAIGFLFTGAMERFGGVVIGHKTERFPKMRLHGKRDCNLVARMRDFLSRKPLFFDSRYCDQDATKRAVTITDDLVPIGYRVVT